MSIKKRKGTEKSEQSKKAKKRKSMYYPMRLIRKFSVNRKNGSVDDNSGHTLFRSDPYREEREKSETGVMILMVVSVFVMLVVITAFFLVMSIGNNPSDPEQGNRDGQVFNPVTDQNGQTVIETIPPTVHSKQTYIPVSDGSETLILQSKINAQNAILVDVNNNKVKAQRLADVMIYPASMTKLMTLIVAVENIDNLNDTFLMTRELVGEYYLQGASMAYFVPGEYIPLIDLLYGAIIPSGAEATAALAIYVAGSEEKFADMMNAKAAEMGLKGTHFVNASGLYDDNHYSTVREIAAILAYALDNPLCKTILEAKYYEPTATTTINEEQTFYYRWRTRIKGNEPTGVTVLGAKSGYETKAGNCLASFATNNTTGDIYILVTANGSALTEYNAERPNTSGGFQPIYDMRYLYTEFAK